ncbi:MAG: hypothetical protein JO153_18875 [Solirubrobacterales bacterium]|nr:hypothetical protein [Solirubrobacterales bacterium]
MSVEARRHPKFGRAQRIADRIWPALGSIWLLGTVVAVLSWTIAFAPPASGLDESWWAAMYMAAHRGMHFGTHVVFTYGPLAFLRQPWLWYPDLAVLGFLYSALLYVALCVSLVWALGRSFRLPWAVLFTTLVLLATPARDLALVLAAIWCLVALSEEQSGCAVWLVAVGGACLGAIENLVELRSGPVIWALCALSLCARRDWRRFLPLFAAAGLLTFIAAWFSAGQAIANLPAFVRTGAEIVTGYSEAMGLSSPSTLSKLAVPLIIAIAIGLVVAAALTTPRGRRRTGAAIVTALAAFALYKEAVVRAEAHHEVIFFSTAAVLACGLAWGRSRILGAVAIAGSATLAVAAAPSDSRPDLNPANHVRQTVDQLRLLFSPNQRNRTTFFFAIGMGQRYGLDPRTLGLLKDQTVHIDPWEAAVAWLYRLRWDPLPVFQSYSAYTSTLDRLNADTLRGRNGPTRILRENTRLTEGTLPAIDSRLPAWEPPQTTVTMLCNYLQLRATMRWQVLGKTRNRCGDPVTVASVASRFGSVNQVPTNKPGGILIVKVEGTTVSSLSERVRTLLARAKFRYVTLNGSSTYRLVPGTSADGLLLDAPPGIDYPAPFNLSPNARTIRFSGPTGPLRLRFERIPVG